MDRYLNDAIAHARAQYPIEACGLVVATASGPVFFPTENASKTYRQMYDFTISPEAFADAEDLGEVIAVVHSHPDTEAYLSPTDSVSHKASNLEWIVIGMPNGKDGDTTLLRVPAAGEQPLLGRQFLHGVNDCYSLIRDYYRMERGVLLPDYPREDEWWLKGQNLYEDNFHAAGFMPVATPEDGDVILLEIRSSVPNHAGIYLNGEILHHLSRRLSSRDYYGTFYRERTRRYLRYCRPTPG